MCQSVQSRPQWYCSVELGDAQGSPDLEHAALAKKVSTSTEAGKVFRDIKTWLCNLSARECLWESLSVIIKGFISMTLWKFGETPLCFILLSLPLSLQSAFSSHLSLALFFVGVFSVATPSDIIFVLHYFLTKSLSCPYKCLSLPSVSFVSYFSFGQHTESCSFVSFLERRAESGCWELDMFFQSPQRERERAWDIDTWTIKFLVQSFSSPRSKDQLKENKRSESML